MGTYPTVRDTPPKGGLIPHSLALCASKGHNCPLKEGPAAYQLVGGVTAYQGFDG